MVTIQALNKNSKVNYYGIEVDPDITWDTWEPGKKYTKKLILKNVKFATQRLNFCVPAKEVFTTTFPKTITLSAGTSFCLPITFKPHKKDVFIDKIDFQNMDGEIFTVPVRALLPKFAVEFPSKISCGTVAAHDVAEQKIVVVNTSELETPFKWNFDAPYSIEPANGIIEPFGQIEFIVTFRPQDVGTYTMAIPFMYGTKMSHQKNLTVTSVAKYPNISLMVDDLNQVDALNEDGQIVIDFGIGSVGQYYDKVITVQNVSEVNASVEIERIDNTNQIDWVFFSSITFSKVPARSIIYIVMQFRPKLVLTSYVENFLIRVSNKCGSFLLKCTAQSDGPIVEASQRSINFFQLKPSEIATQPLYLINHSSCTTVPFEFVSDPTNSVFHIDRISGSIKPNDKIQIVITFRPQNPIQYYRRLVCLIPDQEPIFIDLLGTCHDLNNRPHIIQMKHLLRFQKRQLNGLSYHPPENLMKYWAKKQISLNDKGDSQIEKLEEIKDDIEIIPEMSSWKEFFFSHIEDVLFKPYIGQDKNVVYFKGCEYMDKAEIQRHMLKGTLDNRDLEQINCYTQDLVLQNNTKGSLLIQWTEIKDNPDSIFSISPNFAELSSNETKHFIVTFKPDGYDKIFGTELEAYAYFKSQRQFELVDENLISPSFCVIVKCVGHTFREGHEAFQPIFEMYKSEVVFPSVNTGEMAFSSLTLMNKSDKPIIYDCHKLNEPFFINPNMGYIFPKQKQIFTILCEPKTINACESLIEMQLNTRQDYIEKIPILGSADNAIVEMSNNSELYFGYTNIGNISSQRYTIKNTSRIRLKYTWKIRPNDSMVIRVYPSTGMLLPNEALSQQWIFQPNKIGRITLKALLMVQGLSPFGTLTEPKYFPLRIIGNGAIGLIEIGDCNEIEFPPLVVGSSALNSFIIFNPTDATLYYRLLGHQWKTIDKEPMIEEDETDCLEIKDREGILSGRSIKKITFSVRPKQRAFYQYQIGYVLLDNDKLELDLHTDIDQGNSSIRRVITDKEYELISIQVRGVFPTLRVTDIQGTGSSLWISKVNLWRNFSIDNLNVCLDSDPTAAELIHNVATRASFHRKAPVNTRALIHANIGAAPLNADSSEVRILLENCGNVSSQFVFLLPEDLELDLEYWAETGEYTDEELHQMKIQDNKLFTIEPRSALVEPGQSVTVLIKYNHLVVGTDRLPVLFKLDQGREILLNLIGITLDPTRSYVHFPSNTHVFGPTPIGLHKSPIQYYEMYNAGAVPVHFELDIAPLEKLTEDNFGIPILQCLNPTGDILAGQTCRLEWIFSPVEARTYTVQVPIHLSSGECPEITFTAIAYDQRELGSSIKPGQGSSLSHNFVGQTGVPSIQTIRLPGQLARLNFERVNIGLVPTFSTIRRVVFLNNITEDQNITFSWNVTNSDDAEYVYMSPQNGRLLPRESCTCHVIIQTKNVPRFFEMNLICEIYAEETILKFRHDLLAWEKEESRRNVEFTITEKSNKKEFKRLTSKESSDPFPNRRNTSNISFLPPVLKSPPKSRLLSNQKESTSSSSLTDLNSKNLWFKPQMPKPFFLNFGISGRSCPIDEFQAEQPDQLHKYSINKLSMMEHFSSPVILQQHNDNKITTHVKEDYIMETVITDLIGSIMEDEEFVEAVNGIKKEPIPYYLEFPDTVTYQYEAVFDENGNKYKGTLDIMHNDIYEEDEEEEVSERSIQENNEMELIKNDENEEGETENNIGNKEIKEEKDASKSNIEQIILESLPFGTMIEGILENMLVNIVAEANNREVDLTARPRLIALPPKSAGAMPSNNNI